MVMCSDATVKGGTFFPITVKKNIVAQEMAERLRLPCLYLIDSGGAFLPMQVELRLILSGSIHLFLTPLPS